jgi:hypothetical protein
LVPAQAAGAGRWVVGRAPAPAGSAQSVLESVSCTSWRSCVAVGGFQASKDSGILTAFVDRLQGSHWTLERTPSPAISDLVSVSCSSSNACTAVGPGFENGGPLVERWNGSRWARQAIPASVRILNAVSCVQRRWCVIAGADRVGPAIWVWNGARWSIQGRLPRRARAYGISCRSKTSCTVVGSQYTAGAFGDMYAFAAHWNGRRWAAQPTHSAYNLNEAWPSLSAVACPSAAECVAVGESVATGDSGVMRPFAELWDGTSWMPTHPRVGYNTFNAFESVSCTSKRSCLAVGSGTNPNSLGWVPLAEDWNGTRWIRQRLPNLRALVRPAPCQDCTNNLNGVSCTTGASCTAVGSLGSLPVVIRRR